MKIKKFKEFNESYISDEEIIELRNKFPGYGINKAQTKEENEKSLIRLKKNGPPDISKYLK